MTVPDPSAEQLDLLLELQHTDSRLRRLRRQLEDLPEQRELESLGARITALEREHDDLRVELDRTAAAQRQLEREIDVLTQRRDAERQRLYDGSIVNAREMKAVEAEIATTERRIDEHEDHLLEVLEALEALESKAAALIVARDDASEQVGGVELARDTAAKEILAELAELETMRERQAAGVPDDLLTRYVAAAERGGGTGVGELEGDGCTACRIQLSKVEVSELLTGPPLTTCPQCRRLMVVPA